MDSENNASGWLQSILLDYGLDWHYANLATQAMAILAMLLAAMAANFVARRLLLNGFKVLARLTSSAWDDMLLQRGVLKRLAHLAPALVVYLLIPYVLSADQATLTTIIKTILIVYSIFVGTTVVDASLNVFLDIYRQFPISREIPLKGFVQVIKLAVYFLGAVLIISVIVGKSPVILLSGLGALTAVLMLVFKDTILGLVAGIQLVSNRMLAVGDWIEMPKYGADGDVIEIALTTVKVQNWDKTITTIPTYALISDSFKNWRGMQNSGGRRIKRAIYLDINTIRFLTEEEIDSLKSIQLLRDYLQQRHEEIQRYNETHGVDASRRVNGRRLTNIGTFRAYIEAYLRHHPLINQRMTFLVRQLAPGEKGLPIEIYVFSKDKVWANYERIQADIFDHLLAAVPEFGLRVFQFPTGVMPVSAAGLTAS